MKFRKGILPVVRVITGPQGGLSFTCFRSFADPMGE